jgi:DNA-binding NarL/FixJ family response regulator
MGSITIAVASHKKSSRADCLRLLHSQEKIQIVGEARTGLEAIQVVTQLKPRMLLFHWDLLQGKKIHLLSALRQKSPRTKIILLTRRVSERRIMEALSYGVRGYLNESAISVFLVKAVRMVDSGEAWVPRKIVNRITEMLIQAQGKTNFTRSGLK